MGGRWGQAATDWPSDGRTRWTAGRPGSAWRTAWRVVDVGRRPLGRVGVDQSVLPDRMEQDGNGGDGDGRHHERHHDDEECHVRQAAGRGICLPPSTTTVRSPSVSPLGPTVVSAGTWSTWSGNDYCSAMIRSNSTIGLTGTCSSRVTVAAVDGGRAGERRLVVLADGRPELVPAGQAGAGGAEGGHGEQRELGLGHHGAVDLQRGRAAGVRPARSKRKATRWRPGSRGSVADQRRRAPCRRGCAGTARRPSHRWREKPPSAEP